MSSYAGKRSKRSEVQAGKSLHGSEDDQSDSSRLQALLKEHFEAAFEPLREADPSSVQKEGSHDGSESQSTSESDWEGISDDQDQAIEEVRFNYELTGKHALPPTQYKAFMSSKPPSNIDITGRETEVQGKGSDSEDEVDSANLKNDVALQRLLRESHLLDTENALSHSSNTRQRALDLRFQGLGSKHSVFAQPKMPLAQRKGLLEKAAAREQRRRLEAEENGIVLEKAIKTGKRTSNKRQRAIGAPSVGKFRNGMLTLSKGDVSRIQKPQRPRR